MKTKHKRPKSFNGWDWTELSERWGLDLDLDDDKLLEKTRDIIIKACHYPKCDKKIVRDCKSFLKKLAKADNGYSGPVWEGLLKVKCDETFLKFTYELLPCMWT